MYVYILHSVCILYTVSKKLIFLEKLPYTYLSWNLLLPNILGNLSGFVLTVYGADYPVYRFHVNMADQISYIFSMSPSIA